MQIQRRTSYQQLQPEERMTIASMKQQRASIRAISRDLARNACPALNYLSFPADALSVQRQAAARGSPMLDPARWRDMGAGVDPAEMEVRTPADYGYPQASVLCDHSRQIFHETIYTPHLCAPAWRTATVVDRLPAPRPLQAPAAQPGHRP